MKNLLLIACLLLLSSCASFVVKNTSDKPQQKAAYVPQYSGWKQFGFSQLLQPELENKFGSSVYFTPKSYTLSVSQKAHIVTVVNWLKSQNKAYKIVLMGYANIWQSNSYAMAMSIKRAQAVKLFMILNGMDSKKISLAPFGSLYATLSKQELIALVASPKDNAIFDSQEELNNIVNQKSLNQVPQNQDTETVAGEEIPSQALTSNSSNVKQLNSTSSNNTSLNTLSSDAIASNDSTSSDSSNAIQPTESSSNSATEESSPDILPKTDISSKISTLTPLDNSQSSDNVADKLSKAASVGTPQEISVDDRVIILITDNLKQ